MDTLNLKRLPDRIALFEALLPVIQELKPEQRLRLLTDLVKSHGQADSKWWKDIEPSLRSRTEKLNALLADDEGTAEAYEHLLRSFEKLGSFTSKGVKYGQTCKNSI